MTARIEYQRGNTAAAGIIQADVHKYGGPDSLMSRWARLVLAKRHEQEPSSSGRSAQRQIPPFTRGTEGG